MAGVDGALRRRIIVDLDKSESTSLAGKTIAHDRHRIDGHAVIGKKVLYIRLVCRIREISHKKLLHLRHS